MGCPARSRRSQHITSSGFELRQRQRPEELRYRRDLAEASGERTSGTNLDSWTDIRERDERIRSHWGLALGLQPQNQCDSTMTNASREAGKEEIHSVFSEEASWVLANLDSNDLWYKSTGQEHSFTSGATVLATTCGVNLSLSCIRCR
jgi:hypothetical protein